MTPNNGSLPDPPNIPPPPALPPLPQQPPSPPAPPRASWMEKAAAVVYCVFCIEIGLFLLIYPWMRSWDHNYLIQLNPSLTAFLTSVQFKGAVSGLGILNLFAAVSEIIGLRRYSAR